VYAMALKSQADNPRCSICDDEMELTVLIPPIRAQGYTCPRCGRSHDYLVTSPSKAPSLVAAPS
jgi:transposase-like protein